MNNKLIADVVESLDKASSLNAYEIIRGNVSKTVYTVPNGSFTNDSINESNNVPFKLYPSPVPKLLGQLVISPFVFCEAVSPPDTKDGTKHSASNDLLQALKTHYILLKWNVNESARYF